MRASAIVHERSAFEAAQQAAHAVVLKVTRRRQLSTAVQYRQWTGAVLEWPTWLTSLDTFQPC